MTLSREVKEVRESSGFIHSLETFVEHLLYTSIVLGPGDPAGDKTDQHPDLMS